MTETNVIIQLEGYTNDLLTIGTPDKRVSMKSTRLIDIDPYEKDPDSELVDVAITSTCGNGKHAVFDSMLDKKIRITVETVE